MLLVYATCPDRKSARRIARMLVEKRLAACVSILKIEQSVYRWKGKLVQEGEFLLIIKTAKTRYSKLETALSAIHPYTLPEIIAVKLETGSKRFIRWVETGCNSPK